MGGPTDSQQHGGLSVQGLYPRGIILVESEPQDFLNMWIPEDVSWAIAVVITINPDNVIWWQSRFTATHKSDRAFWVPQGYDRAIDPLSNTIPISINAQENMLDRVGSFLTVHHNESDNVKERGQTYNSGDSVFDVVMPGGENTDDRIRAVQKLRDAGLTVDTSLAFGANLDIVLGRARVHAYYPATKRHRHYATQRILLGINKCTQTVAVRSDDEQSEWLYGGLYETCAHDEESFVRACLNAAARNNWRERGIRARDVFAVRCDAQRLFEEACTYPVASTKTVRLLDMLDKLVHRLAPTDA